MKNTNTTNRLQLLDSLRGLLIISMIIYHGVWDIVYVFGVELSWYKTDAAYLWQQSICWGFILISGFCSTFGKNKLYRGLKILLFSGLISLFTALFMRDNLILFGILTLIGSGILFILVFDKFFKKINPYLGLLVFFILFILTKNVGLGYIGIGNFKIFELPTWLYKNYFTAFCGFFPEVFVSYDYFPLIPWLFLYVSEYLIYRIFEKLNLLRFLKKPSIPVLSWLGKHSLVIYVLHQPILYLVLYPLFKY